MSYPLVSIGVDPDVHNCAVAVVKQYECGTIGFAVQVIREKRGKSRDASIAMLTDNVVFDTLRLTAVADVLAVEGQDARYTGSTCARPQDIVALALVSGACLATIPARLKLCPLPREWKATTRKDIKQRRILDRLEVPYTMKGGSVPYEQASEGSKKKYYPVPDNFEQYVIGDAKVNAGDWADLTDALGLAVWGLEKLRYST